MFQFTVNGEPVEEFVAEEKEKEQNKDIVQTLTTLCKKVGHHRTVGNVFKNPAINKRPGKIKQYNETEKKRYEFMEMNKDKPAVENVSVKRILLDVILQWDDVFKKMVEIGMMKAEDDSRFCPSYASKFLLSIWPNDTRFINKNLSVSMSAIRKVLEPLELIDRDKSKNKGAVYVYNISPELYTFKKSELWKKLSPKKLQAFDTKLILPDSPEYEPKLKLKLEKMTTNKAKTEEVRKEAKERPTLERPTTFKAEEIFGKVEETDTLSMVTESIMRHSTKGTTVEICSTGSAFTINIVVGGK